MGGLGSVGVPREDGGQLLEEGTLHRVLGMTWRGRGVAGEEAMGVEMVMERDLGWWTHNNIKMVCYRIIHLKPV